MKKWLAMLAGVSVAWSVHAQVVREGGYEGRLGTGIAVLPSEDDANPSIIGGFGYYIQDQVLVGGLVSFEDKEVKSYWGIDDVFGLGAFYEYHLVTDLVFTPYFGGSVMLYDGDDADRDMVYVLSVLGGAKYAVTDTIALYGQLSANLASEDMFGYERDFSEFKTNPDVLKGSGENVGMGLDVGLRFSF